MKTSTVALLAVTVAVAAGGGYFAYTQAKKKGSAKKKGVGGSISDAVGQAKSWLSPAQQLVKDALASGQAKAKSDPWANTRIAGLGSLGGSVF